MYGGGFSFSLRYYRQMSSGYYWNGCNISHPSLGLSAMGLYFPPSVLAGKFCLAAAIALLTETDMVAGAN